MKEQIGFLIELQKIELRIDKYKEKMEELPRRLHELNEELKSGREMLKEEEQRNEQLQHIKREKEKELEEENERVKKMEARLKQIKTNRQYQALLKEIAENKSFIQKLEEDLLKIMGEAEEAQRRLDSLKAEWLKKQEEMEKEIQGIKKEMKEIEKLLKEETNQKDKLISHIRSDILKKFNLIRSRRNGIAIVPTRNGACGGCYIDIPPQLFNEILKNGSLITCPNCHRILFWEGNIIARENEGTG